jgi:hypothetical protein
MKGEFNRRWQIPVGLNKKMTKYFSIVASFFLFTFFVISPVAAQTCDADSNGAELSKAIVASYIPSKNETFVGFKQLPDRLPIEFDLSADKIVVLAGYDYTGQTQSAAPAAINLYLYVHTNGRFVFEKEKTRAVVIQVDDQPVLSGIFSRSVPIPYDVRIQDRMEQLKLEIPLKDFAKIASGKKIVFAFGDKEIKLGKQHVKRFCQLLNYAEAAVAAD